MRLRAYFAEINIDADGDYVRDYDELPEEQELAAIMRVELLSQSQE